jgi:hypothetical protein
MDAAAGREGVQAKIEVTFPHPIVPPCWISPWFIRANQPVLPLHHGQVSLLPL